MQCRAQFWRTIAGLVLLAVSFGYVEAAVVVYLRSLYLPLRLRFYPTVPRAELFPLLTLQQLRGLGPEHAARLRTEVGRELATLLMLAGVAVTAARKPREWMPAFMIAFGIWDAAFYASLKLLLNWPASLLTWDILFLFPLPWVGPVLAPVLVSLSMIGAGVLMLWRDYSKRPIYVGRIRWLFIVTGGVLILIAFMLDFRNTMAGGLPNAFHWEVFFAGEAIGLLAFASAVKASR